MFVCLSLTHRADKTLLTRISFIIITQVSWYLWKNFAITHPMVLHAITISDSVLFSHSITMHFCVPVYVHLFTILLTNVTKWSLLTDLMGLRFMVNWSASHDWLWWGYIWPNISTWDAGNETDGKWLIVEKASACDALQGIFQSEVTILLLSLCFHKLNSNLSGLRLLSCPAAHQTCRVFLSPMMKIPGIQIVFCEVDHSSMFVTALAINRIK